MQAPPPLQVCDGPPAGPGVGGKMSSGAWKRGPEIAVGVISLWLHITSLCAGNSPGTGEFPAQMASKAENVSIWWRHHVGDVSPLNSLRISLLHQGQWWRGSSLSKMVMPGKSCFLMGQFMMLNTIYKLEFRNMRRYRYTLNLWHRVIQRPCETKLAISIHMAW